MFCSSSSETTGRGRIASAIGALVVLFLLGLCLHNIAAILPASRWGEVFRGPPVDDIPLILLRESLLPRLIVAVLCGWALGLAGALFQVILRNKLAEPTTLGVSAGAQLALVASTFWLPELWGIGRLAVAFAGAAGATGTVFLLAWDRILSPGRLISAGLFVCLYCGALATVPVLLHGEALRGLFVWSSGSLLQDGWSAAWQLAALIGPISIIVFPLTRSMSLLALEDAHASALGLSVKLWRMTGILLAMLLSATVVSAVGVIGFIGLAAPALTRLAGARSPASLIAWSPAAGSLLLVAADQGVQALFPASAELPTGIATAIIGSSLVLWLSRRAAPEPPAGNDGSDPLARRLSKPALWLSLLAFALGALAWMSVHLGQGPTGWHFGSGDAWERVLSLRLPRVAVALAAGAALGGAGMLIQRLTGNPMASPELLGISSGAALAIVAAVLWLPIDNAVYQTAAASAGGAAALLALLVQTRRGPFASGRLVLVGVMLGTFMSAVVSLLLVSGDPRMAGLLPWMAGTTYQATFWSAGIVTLMTGVGLASAAATARWLTILPLGQVISRGVGVPIRASHIVLISITALLTGTAVVSVGPLSFVGLLAPHMVTMSGLQRPLHQLFGSAMLGACLMVLADWLGRNLLFPFEIPAGLFAAIVSGPYFFFLMWSSAKARLPYGFGVSRSNG
ncbi:Fe3+-hydroxamate ABC transporter permease FhuB [Labrys sp. WJW]|uniref:Fe(3+)-hydroxamate ABC transporter permease FhuB n=1 Tax=Labrys sp. WJW TaxID=1737983 RepID=UPI0008350FAF|nr:Fe(3+)-hydroxamate ABC transporter permease FhuB [Labrys sp. WJW]OCC05491.1 Fe3+-hydroxamate ABC transporter permease FhuB [Labrys sp. WJW]